MPLLPFLFGIQLQWSVSFGRSQSHFQPWVKSSEARLNVQTLDVSGVVLSPSGAVSAHRMETLDEGLAFLEIGASGLGLGTTS